MSTQQMSINQPSIAQLMSYPKSMSTQQMNTEPNAMSAQQMSTWLLNLYEPKCVVCSAHPARIRKIPRSLMGIYQSTNLLQHVRLLLKSL